MKRVIYLDWAAGALINPKLAKASLNQALAVDYNSQALYAGAQTAAAVLQDCRQVLAQILQVKPTSLFFTNGASSSNQLLFFIFKQLYAKYSRACLEIDHQSLHLESDLHLQVNPKTAQLKPNLIKQLPDQTLLLSVAGINSELGVWQDFKLLKRELIALRQHRQAQGNQLPLWLHIDASQLAGVSQLGPNTLAGADFITINGAKVGAFKQTGLLYVNPRLDLNQALVTPFDVSFLETGTPSILQAVALKLNLIHSHNSRLEFKQHLQRLKHYFIPSLQALGAKIPFLKQAQASPILLALFPNCDNERLALSLSNHHIYVGVGSACQSHNPQDSALMKLGYSLKQAQSSLRFSFGLQTSLAQLKRTIAVLKELLVNETD